MCEAIPYRSRLINPSWTFGLQVDNKDPQKAALSVIGTRRYASGVIVLSGVIIMVQVEGTADRYRWVILGVLWVTYIVIFLT